MKEIKFVPLRRVKKTGKIVVAGYMQWNKVRCADYNEFQLMLSDEHVGFSPDEFVHNHKGELLFWYNHQDPEALSKNYPSIESAINILGVDPSVFEGEEWKLSEPLSGGFHWSVKGFDCAGTPTFSHGTANYIATFYNDVTEFEPLTVGVVLKWYGYFLWKLKNANINR